MKNTAILLIDCPDRKGIVAAVGDFLYRHNANITGEKVDQNRVALTMVRVHREWKVSAATAL